MNDHNLDDLIIDNMEPNNGKVKSILTIIALLIIVLIVAIILTKIILKDPNEGKISLDHNTEMISPELTLQNVSKKKEVKEETKLSTIIEKELNEPVKAPKVKKIVKTAQPVQAEEPKEKFIEAPKPKAGSVEITKKFDQSVTETKVKPKVIETPKIKEKMIVPKVEPTPVKEKKVETITSVSERIYYIQAGSFTQAPSSRLLSSIKNNGFNYRIKTVGKTKKVQIGPFKNRSAADTALIRIRDRIRKDSFVVNK